MKTRLLVFAAVVLLVAACAAFRCVLDERRDPLFTFEEHANNFISNFSVGLMVAAVGLLVSLASRRRI